MPDFSQLPSVEKLAHALANEVTLPRPLITGFVKRSLVRWRERLAAGEDAERETIEKDILTTLKSFASSRLQPVINATGVLIHTNLGRSPLGQRATSALGGVATGYSNLEFNLLDGKRGQRASYLETALAVLLETEAATAVNNCAAALVLALRTLISPEKNEVIVSRGELVEIGGGFRIPEVLETSGARLVEVGATNKTHLDDYAGALTEQTALILKVHRSNFYLGGFTAEPAVPEIASLARKHGIPLVEDLGSGAVMNTDELAPIDHEPTPQEALRNGIDLVIFSGDKLLGGPQSGIIAGDSNLVSRIKAEPFFRAVRCDKLILTTLQSAAETYLHGEGDTLPLNQALHADPAALKRRANKLAKALAGHPAIVSVGEGESQVGGGALPQSNLPSITLNLVPENLALKPFAERLRRAGTPVIGVIGGQRFRLDLRTIFPGQDQALLQSIKESLT